MNPKKVKLEKAIKDFEIAVSKKKQDIERYEAIISEYETILKKISRDDKAREESRHVGRSS